MKIRAAAIPGANPLFSDYVGQTPELSPFFAHPFQDEAAVQAHLDVLKSRTYPREQVAAVLHRQNKKFGAGDAVHINIDKLRYGQAFVIITGQQTGLFGGPLFVLYKALTAIKLAERWSRICGGCFIPMFWLASDDADFAEVNHAYFLGKSHSLERTGVAAARDGAMPMAQMPFGEDIEEALAHLQARLVESEFQADILAALREAYSSGRTVADAFGVWLARCLRQFGLVLIDPADPELKACTGDIFRREIEERSPSTRRVLETSAALEKLGYTPQVPLREGRLNIFHADPERRPLELGDDENFRTTDGEMQFSESELRSVATERPEVLSPNVILRALTQDAMLPTVAYVAGPSEIAYFAQLKGVYEHFDVPMPVIYPRKSLTLLDPAIDRLLDKHNLTVLDAWGKLGDALKERIRDSLPPALLENLAKLQQDWPETLKALQPLINQVDPTLERMLENSAGRVAGTIAHLEKKVMQAGKRQSETLQAQFDRIAAALFPNGTLQERVHNPVSYFVKYGFGFADRLYDVLDIADTDHQVVRL